MSKEYRNEQDAPPLRLYQASTSEMFGRMVENPTSETTPFYPRLKGYVPPIDVKHDLGHDITGCEIQDKVME